MPHYNHSAEDAWVSAEASGGGGDYDYSEYSYPAAQQQQQQQQQQQHLDQQNEHGANPDYRQQRFYSQSQVGRHEAGAEFDGQQQVHRSATQGDDDMMMYQEPAAEDGDAPPTNHTVGTPTPREAVAEKIVAAATDVHQAVQYALQLGAASSTSSSSSSSKTVDVVDGNDNEAEKEDVDDDDEEFHHGMGRDQEGTAMMLADEGGEGRRRRRERRREEHTGGGGWSTNGGGRDDDGDEADDALGGDGSTWTTYDRRRAARGVLRGLVALEKTIEALSPSSSSMLAASMTHDNDSMSHIGDDDNGANNLVGDGEASSGTNAEANGTATLTIALEELMIDLLMVPTAVRTSLLANMRTAGDIGEENEDCDGSHVGGRGGNVGNNGIVQLLDESDTIASRIVVQYLNKSTDQYRLLASLVPAQPLPPWNSVDGLLGRVFPQFVAVNGGKTYPAYRKTTATMLGVINTIGSVYAAQGLSIEIPAIDAFVLCHYLARRGLSDLTATNAAPPAVLDGGEYSSGMDAVQEDAALQLRKLIVRVLGRLLECLAGARAGMGMSTFASKGLLHSLVAESQRLQASGENSGTLVSANDVEDCVDVLAEYCTEIMEYALDSLDSFNAQVKSVVSDEGIGRKILPQGQSKIGDAHVEGLRTVIRSVQIAAKTFSTLHQLGIHPEPSTLKSFVANLSDFWAISCNKLMRLARRPLGDGGMTHHLAEDLQLTVDALGQQLIHISMLTGPRRAVLTGGRQRGGNKSSKKNSKEEKSTHFVAIVNAVSQSQRGGSCDDLYALLHGFVKKSIGPEMSQCRITSGRLKCGDFSRSNAFNRDAKRRRTKVSFEDDCSMDQNVPGNSHCGRDENDMDANKGGNEDMDKEEPMFLVKKADEEETADMNLVSSCILSSLLLPEFPSLALHAGNSGNDDGNYHPGASFEQSYKTTAALATGMSIQSGGDDDNIRSLVCDPTSPWHALIGRKIADTVSKRDASGIGPLVGGGTDDVDFTLSNARGVLLRHAGACQSVAS